MTFDDYYADVPAEQREALRQFRETYPTNTLRVQGVDWHYLTGGSGTETILWLVGGLRVADAAFRSIPLLADAFRIIAPDFAPVNTMAELTDGLAAILDAEKVTRAHVLAGSFGGMVAQVFVRRHPQHVHKLILSTTAPPNQDTGMQYQEQAAMFAEVDEALLRAGAKQQLFTTIAPPDHEAVFWRAYLNELFTARLGKADILSTYHCMVDFMLNSAFTPDDLRAWQGRILMIDSDNDATFGTDVQAQLRALYPSAHTHTFKGAGHSPSSTQRDAYFALVRDFLLKSESLRV